MNVGQIVTIADLGFAGVITKVIGEVFQVTTLTGTRYAREAHELAPSAETDAAQFAQDVKILAPGCPELAEAFAQVIGPTDTVVPGTVLRDIPLSVTMPSGNIITRRETAAEMIRTWATPIRPRPDARGPRVRSVTEMI